MGVGMDLEFDKYCKVDESPRTVLKSSHHNARPEGKSRKSKSSSRNSQASLEAGFKDIKLRNYHRSVSCKTLPIRNNELTIDREVLKRGSVYQSSNKRKSFKKPDGVGGRKKIELSLNGDSPFSFSLLDSICDSDEEDERPCSSTNTACSVQHCRKTSSCRLAERDLMEDSKFKSYDVVGRSSTANVLEEYDNQALSQSLSDKLALPHSPTRSYNSSVSHLTPIRRMLDPSTKSKSHRIPSKLESGGKNKTLQKWSLRDFSSAAVAPCSPAHLHGDLKVEHKHGVPYIELSLAHSENVLVAKTWKAEDALNSVYTFYSFPTRKKSNASGYGVKYSNKDTPMVGQMQVSCHLCSELKEGGALSNSMMAEFVLYDIMHPRKSFAAEELGPDEGSPGPIKLNTQAVNAFEHGSLDLLIPWTAVDLHPSHEIAAVVIQVPFEKRESLKHRSGDTSLSEQTPKGIADNSTSTRIRVVTPLGNHSMPAGESRGPLPLLDRWRLGGGCECGGWDMACPLNVFDNLSTRCKGDQLVALYVQGAKESSPALTMKSTRKGKYSVDFHAQLSALQALAICVAVLHAAEASPLDQEKNKQLLQRCSKKVLADDEVKLVIKASEDHPASFVLDPPFSPIARV